MEYAELSSTGMDAVHKTVSSPGHFYKSISMPRLRVRDDPIIELTKLSRMVETWAKYPGYICGTVDEKKYPAEPTKYTS